MSHSESRVMAGLIFQGEQQIDLLDAITRTESCLTRLGQKVQSLGFLSDQDAGVETDHYRICLTLSENVVLPEPDFVADMLLRLDVSRRDPSHDDTGPGIDALLARVAIDLCDQFRPTHLQWIEAEAILSAEDLVAATQPPEDAARADRAQDEQKIARARAALTVTNAAKTKPVNAPKNAQVCNASRTAPARSPEDTTISGVSPSLDVQTNENSAQTDRLRLSAWLLSIAVACIALPVGITLLIINLIKGENLRLVSQTAALSGLFVSLQANGATAAALQVVQDVLR